MRVGLGFDSHRFDPARPLRLGGIVIPEHPGLAGHSDGDAVTHAVIDALLGASGAGSIGDLFPDTDPALEGEDSIVMLRGAVRRVEGENYQVVNVDVTVVTETPRIGPHAAAMSDRLSEVLHVPPAAVSVRGKSNEGMGWVGRGEGLAVLAVVLLDAIRDLDTLHATIRSGG
jgi:2-C-methyl-D-erythritol 2,4-cyclodiphosphate synthase